MDNLPNPGSDEALDQGCKCPVLDNRRGKGAYEKDGKPLFWISDQCPMHYARPQINVEPKDEVGK